jgi:DNA-binding MarR family transcriptional regulator
MSIQAVSAALKTKGLGPSDKLLLLALANYADDQMKCWPSHRTLADDTGLSQRTILTSFKRLEDAGLLSRAYRPRADGSRASDIITLSLGGEIVAPRGEMIAPRVGKQLRGGGETVAPLTTFEPSLEPSKEPSVAEPVARRTPTRAEGLSIWKACPRLARQRSSQIDVLKALEAAMRRGHTPQAVEVGLLAAYASKTYAGDHAKGIHLLIQNDRWQSFVDEPAETVASEWSDDRWSAAVALHREEGLWSDKLGPAPGLPGCRVPPHLIPANASPSRQGFAA